MTAALEAMVAAMAAEFERQKAADAALPWEQGGHIHSAEASRRFNPGEADDGEITSVYLMGRFDLQKVARAGLAAIPVKSDPLGRSVGLAMKREQLRNISVGSIWAVQEAMIDAILKDDPK